MDTTLTRHQIRLAFAKNRGAAAQLARDLNLKAPTVSLWLRGKVTSKRIADAAAERAVKMVGNGRAA